MFHPLISEHAAQPVERALHVAIVGDMWLQILQRVQQSAELFQQLWRLETCWISCLL